MDEKLLSKLLREHNEKDWLEFKAKLRLYQSDGTLVIQQRDEFIKDILGLANGNSHIIRKTKYLIIGADDEKFDDNGCRILHNVDYKVPSQKDIAQWLSGTCAHAIVGLEAEEISFQGINLFVITVPPTFNLHETIHELKAARGTFQKHTVFMRQDQNTVPASVRDGITIEQLKQLHRQEISNPSATWIGALAGAIVGLLVGASKIESTQANLETFGWFMQLVFTLIGISFGAFVGWFSKQWNEIRYDFRYKTLKEKIIFLAIIIVVIMIASIVSSNFR